MALSSVVFPAPLGPMIARISPGWISRLTRFTAMRAPKRTLTPSTFSKGPPPFPLMGSPRKAAIVGFRSPRPLGPQPQGGLQLALRPRDVLRLALPRSPVALLDGGAAAEVVEAG